MNIPEALKSCSDSENGYFFDIGNALFLLYIFFCRNQVKMGQSNGLNPLILKDSLAWYDLEYGTDLRPDTGEFPAWNRWSMGVVSGTAEIRIAQCPEWKIWIWCRQKERLAKKKFHIRKIFMTAVKHGQERIP